MSAAGWADTIRDFNYNQGDRIDMPIAGSFQNCEVFNFSGVNSIADARAVAETGWLSGYLSDANPPTYVFIGNPQTDMGYLLIDENRNGQFEAAIVLQGVGQIGEFHPYAIV